METSLGARDVAELSCAAEMSACNAVPLVAILDNVLQRFYIRLLRLEDIVHYMSPLDTNIEFDSQLDITSASSIVEVGV